jgi:hypothetical protein
MNQPNKPDCFITLLERLTSDKPSNLLGQFLSYEENEVLWIRTQIFFILSFQLFAIFSSGGRSWTQILKLGMTIQALYHCVSSAGRHEWDCHSRENEWDGTGQKETEQDWTITVLVLKYCWLPLMNGKWDSFYKILFRSFEQDGISQKPNLGHAWPLALPFQLKLNWKN